MKALCKQLRSGLNVNGRKISYAPEIRIFYGTGHELPSIGFILRPILCAGQIMNVQGSSTKKRSVPESLLKRKTRRTTATLHVVQTRRAFKAISRKRKELAKHAVSPAWLNTYRMETESKAQVGVRFRCARRPPAAQPDHLLQQRDVFPLKIVWSVQTVCAGQHQIVHLRLRTRQKACERKCDSTRSPVERRPQQGCRGSLRNPNTAGFGKLEGLKGPRMFREPLPSRLTRLCGETSHQAVQSNRFHYVV